MRYANLIAHSHITRRDRPENTAETRRAFNTERAAVKLATESAKRFADTTAALVRRDGTFDRSAIMTAATRCAQARMEVTGDAWGVCMAFALKGGVPTASPCCGSECWPVPSFTL